jgi:hypothetical protein
VRGDDLREFKPDMEEKWIAHTLHAVGWMVPGELALFGLDELERAKEWAAG